MASCGYFFASLRQCSCSSQCRYRSVNAVTKMHCCSERKTAFVQPFCSARCSTNKSLKQRCFNVFCIVRAWLPPPWESQDYSTVMGVPPQIEAMLFTGNLQNHIVSLHVWVSTVKWSFLLVGLLTESVEHTRRMGAPPKVQPMFVTSTYRIIELHYTYGNATLR